jgi:geranylgeranyl diphosphate synthase type II
MDKAATRRGNPTVHKLYGTNIAINTGDMMFSLAYRYVGITEKPHMRKLCEMFNKTVVEVIEGPIIGYGI